MFAYTIVCRTEYKGFHPQTFTEYIFIIIQRVTTTFVLETFS